MTRTISQIYRLGFIIFYLWTTFERAVLSTAGFWCAFSDLAQLSATVCFVAVLAVFICSLLGRIPTAVLKIKAACTATALLVFILNISIFFLPTAGGWILKVLLPTMMILDWLLFDKKGSFRVFDPLFWLLAILLILGLCSLILHGSLHFPALLELLGRKENLLTTLLALLASGALMYGLDKLISGKGWFNPWNVFCLLYRITFLLLMGYALYEIADGKLVTLFFSMKRFAVLAGFLCFLCIAVVLIFCLLRANSGRARSPFPRIKGVFTLLALTTVLGYHFFVKGGIVLSFPWQILLYIGPIMMIFDWILFDSKGKCKPYDPLWWALVPMIYFVVLSLANTFFLAYPSLSAYSMELFFCGGVLILLAIGYGIYLLDLALKHK